MQMLASYNRNDFGHELHELSRTICGNLYNSWQKYGARNSPREGWKRKSFLNPQQREGLKRL